MSDPTNDALALADTEVHVLRSAAVGDEFKIFVGHCPSRAGTAAGATPVYLTDANGWFGCAVDAIRSLQLSRHLPPLLVVGIGYRRDGLADTFDLRARDLTPVVDPAYSKIFPNAPVTGGARAFLSFIRDELQPWVRERFAVGADSAYVGHSFGGLFGTWALLHAPESFARWLIASPSLWFGREHCFAQEAEVAARRDDLPARVWFGIGAAETHEGRQREAAKLPEEQRAKAGLRHLDMVDDLARFVGVLRGRGYPSLRIDHEVLADEFHISVMPAALTRGLRALFDAPRAEAGAQNP